MNKLSGFRNLLSSLIVLAGVVIAVAFLVYQDAAPAPVEFAKFDIHTVLDVMGGLFLVALMTERAVEVIISVLRDADAQVLSTALDMKNKELQAARLGVPLVPETIAALTAELAGLKQALANYRIDTRETSYCISFLIGVALALVGVRGLHGLLAASTDTAWFALVDIVVTGAVIAGGSDGIHRMVSAILDFFNMLSATSDKKTAAAGAP